MPSGAKGAVAIQLANDQGEGRIRLRGVREEEEEKDATDGRTD